MRQHLSSVISHHLTLYYKRVSTGGYINKVLVFLLDPCRSIQILTNSTNMDRTPFFYEKKNLIISKPPRLLDYQYVCFENGNMHQFSKLHGLHHQSTDISQENHFNAVHILQYILSSQNKLHISYHIAFSTATRRKCPSYSFTLS